jgi:uncharacterized membrane protein YeaQ/YmgE (transglycosylase-associated protein family)
MPRLDPTAAALTGTILAAALLVYVFGATSIVGALLWASVGAAIGWLGSLVMHTNTQRRILLDILAGAVGGVCGVLLFGGGSLTEGGLVERILSAILGSAFLVFVAGFARRRWPIDQKASSFEL